MGKNRISESSVRKAQFYSLHKRWPLIFCSWYCVNLVGKEMNKTLQELLGLQIIKTPDGVIIEPEKKLTHLLLSLWKDPCSKYFLLLNIDGVKMGGDAISAKYLLVNENFESQGRIELLMLLKGKEKYSTYQNNLPFLAPFNKQPQNQGIFS